MIGSSLIVKPHVCCHAGVNLSEVSIIEMCVSCKVTRTAVSQGIIFLNKDLKLF